MNSNDVTAWQTRETRRSRARGFAGLAVAGAMLVAGLVAVGATPAAASQNQTFKVWDVTFSEDDCSGKTVVTLVNNTDDLRGDGAGLVFNVDGTSVAVDAGATKTVDIAYPQSKDVDVALTGVYETPEVEEAVKSKQAFELVKEWHHEWNRPAGCWDITAVSTCDNKLVVTVKNTAPAPSAFTYNINGVVRRNYQPILGNASLSFTFASDKTITVKYDDTFKVFQYEKPVCTTPPVTTPPATTLPPVVNAPQGELPVTGASLTAPLGVGTGLMLLGAGAIVFILWRRRRGEDEDNTAEFTAVK